MKEREVFLDKLRVMATCAVVLLHTITGVMDNTDMSFYPLENKVFLVALDLICWCVPVFLLISGYLFLNPAREIGMKQMLVKYCRRIVLALLLFGVPYACLEQVAVERSFRPEMIAEGFWMVLRGESWSHMWYLYLILLLYFLTPAMKWLLARIPRKLLYVLLAVLFVGCSVLPYVWKLLALENMPALPEGGIYFFYYMCGYLFVVKKRPAGRFGHGEVSCDAGKGNEEGIAGGKAAGYLPVFASLLAAGMALSRLPGIYMVQMAYNYPFTVALSLLLFSWGQNDKTTKGSNLWGQVSAFGFTIYLVHPFYLNIAYKFLHITLLSFPIAVSLPLFFVYAVLLSAVTAWILRKIPPLREYVL